MSLYTKKGDTGFTSTMNRMMIEKSSPVFHLLGTLDEFTSALGMAKPWVPAQLLEIVRQIQNDVILLSEEIAGGPRFATHERVASLEKAVDSVSETLPQHFETQSGGALGPAVPGASKAGAALDLARAIVRRAEREAVALSQRRGLSRDIMAWLNRISDLTYAMARLSDELSSAQNVSSEALNPAFAEPAKPAGRGGEQAAPLGSPADSLGSGPAAPLPYAPGGPNFTAQAVDLCSRVLVKARELGFRASAAVCDSGGFPVCSIRDDGALLASVDIAANKAFTSVSMKMSTKQLAPLDQPGASLYGIQFTNGGRIVVFGGGVPLEYGGAVVGGFGVSGGTEEQDTHLADIALQLFNASLHSVKLPSVD